MSVRGMLLPSIAVLVFSALTVVASDLPAAAAPLRVMSFNIRGDFDLELATDSSEAWNSLTGTHRRDLAATTIREIDPDLFGVEEAFSHQLNDLKSSLANFDFYGVGRDDGALAGESCAIFYRRVRFRPVNEGTFWLSKKPDEVGSIFPGAGYVRIASWVILADSLNSGRELLVLNTHWDNVSELARQHGADMIRERIGSLAGGRPVVVMGDLNDPEESPPVQNLQHADSGTLKLFDSFREIAPTRSADEATYHAFTGKKAGSRIDFILHSDGFKTLEASIVHRDFDGRYPSDHFPVTAVLDFAADGAGENSTAPR